MVDNLEDSYFELSEANKNMELKVEQRTKQLQSQIEVRNQAEEKLKATNKMVYSIINTSPLPIVTLSIDYKVKTASPAFSQIFKFEEYEVIDRVLPFVIMSDVDMLREMLQALNEPNQVERRIVMGRRKDGMLMDLNITAVSEFDDTNEKFGYILVIDDITERLLAEKALRESEIKYRSLIEDSIVGIGLVKDNNFVYANNALLEIWKCHKMPEFLSVPFIELVSPGDRESIINLLNASSDDSEEIATENVELEIKIICFDSSEKYVHLASNVLYLESEVLMQITFVDITDRKNAETEMRRLNEELEERVVDRTSKLNKTLVDLRNEMSQRAKLSKDLQFKSEVLEYTTSFCIVFNKKGDVVYASPFSLSLLGWESADLTGTGFWEKVPANTLEGEELNAEMILKWLNDKETLSSTHNYVLEIKTHNDTTKYLQLSNSAGQNNTLIMAGAEITEQVKTQRALEEMGKRLEKTLEGEKELNELKTRFISMVSHEFRTPLTVILNCSSVIEQAFESNRADIGMQYLDKISKSVKTMNELMEDVLLIGKGQTSKIKFVDEIDFAEFVNNSLRDIQEAYNFTSKAALDIKDECKPFFSDESALKHIVHNLITNALK
jgi:PAS domain S-box-containing protein